MSAAERPVAMSAPPNLGAEHWAWIAGQAQGMNLRLAGILRRMINGSDLVMPADSDDNTEDYDPLDPARNMLPEIRAALTEVRELGERIERLRFGS